MSLYNQAANADFEKLHKLRIVRAEKAGIKTEDIPAPTEGGDYILVERMFKAGIPQTHGKREFALLASGQAHSMAAAI